MITGKNYIGNQLSAEGSTTYRTFNPQLNIENESVFVEATANEINNAVALASEAYKEFVKTSGTKKAAFLNTIADEILALDDLLIKTYCSETGLPEGRAKRSHCGSISILCRISERGQLG
jgi:NADP-dependent aldehyde dehydrogenase